jgi:uridine kinase
LTTQVRQSNQLFNNLDAFDYEIFLTTVQKLKLGGAVDIPVYDFKTHSRLDKTECISGADVIIIEGILIFFSKDIREMMDMKIFVDTDSDVRLARRSMFK